jgi:hypothetical protein
MNAVAALKSTISDPMTWAEIRERYPAQRVCLVEMDFAHPNDFWFRTARVVGHGQTPTEAFEQARPWRERYTQIGHFSTAKLKPPIRLPRIVMTDEIRELIRNRR